MRDGSKYNCWGLKIAFSRSVENRGFTIGLGGAENPVTYTLVVTVAVDVRRPIWTRSIQNPEMDAFSAFSASQIHFADLTGRPFI